MSGIFSVAEIRDFVNPNLEICGILFTFVDKQTKFLKEIINLIKETYGEEINWQIEQAKIYILYTHSLLIYGTLYLVFIFYVT